jgi:transposase-like protein
MKKRRTAEQWQEILAKQKESGMTDAQVAQETGASVSGIRGWRQRLKNRGANPQPLVEVSPLLPMGQLRVHLPNGLIVEVPAGWPSDRLAEVVGHLRAL